MRTIRTKVYKFDELTPEAQSKAVSNLNYIPASIKVIATSNIWHNLVKAGHVGLIVKVMESGFNAYFPLSDQYSYQDQIFYCSKEQVTIQANEYEFLKDGSFYHNKN